MNITKYTYKLRLRAIMLMVVAWNITSPIFKTYFDLLPTTFFSIVGILVVLIGLFQKPLRKNLTVVQLMWLLISMDIFYIIGMSVLNYIGDIKYMLIFDMVIDGPYIALVMAANGQLESYYLSKFKPAIQDHFKATVMNLKQWSVLVGFSLAGVLSFILNVHEIVWLKLIIMSVAVYLEYRSIKT